MSKKKPQNPNPDGEMSLSEHLRELRNRALICVIVFFIAAVAGMNYAKDIVELLLELGRDCNYQFVYISPQELLLQYFSVAIILGVCVAFPVLLYEVWAFIKPGLRKNENMLFITAMLFGTLCFIAGIFFACRLMLPFVLVFLDSINQGTKISAYISVQQYLSFILTVLMIFGIVFELPVVSVLLNRFGFLKVEWMKKGRRAAIVIVFIVAAVITPPDIVSQIMVAVPMIGLYEISIFLCSACQRMFGAKGFGDSGDTQV